MKKDKKEEKKQIKRRSNSINVLLILLAIVSLISIAGYLFLSIINSSEIIENTTSILNVSFFGIIALAFIIYSFYIIKSKKDYGIVIIGSILFSAYCLFNIALMTETIKLPYQKYIEDFTNKELTEVVKWATANNITLNQIYETSDSIKEYKVISQNVKEGTLLKNIKELTITISEGPNLDKEVIVPSFVGRTVDDVIKFAENNFLSNIKINFEESDTTRDQIIEQSKSGQVKRNTEIVLVASIGTLSEIGNMEMEDLTTLDLFHSTTWLKRYGFKYKIEYEYSNEVDSNYVLGQSIEKGKNVNPLNSTITLKISKGPKIIVPNLLEMTVDEITEWVVDNKLKISFTEIYDDKTESGKVLEADKKEKDEISQGTLINITISKGPLRMEEFTSIADFRAWAEEYKILYTEEYEFSDKVASGNIISTSVEKGKTIKNNETIRVVVSQGRSVQIPNFVGKSRTEISKTCSSVGLKCTFRTGSYNNNVSKDYATAQSKKAGSLVTSGSSITITLSLGSPKTYNIVIQSSWLSPGDPDSTISTLKNKLETACPGVTFKFEKKTVNTGVGLITPTSPVKGGSNTFIQGRTYTIYVGKA